GAGFIGSHLVDRLLNEGFEVMVVDNLDTGRLKNIAHHQGNENRPRENQLLCCGALEMEDLFDGAEKVFFYEDQLEGLDERTDGPYRLEENSEKGFEICFPNRR
ncbi:MAG: GDP-mannose 4,6-dehydratase, partial [Candidatus Bathyarchaeota archaeon]